MYWGFSPAQYWCNLCTYTVIELLYLCTSLHYCYHCRSVQPLFVPTTKLFYVTDYLKTVCPATKTKTSIFFIYSLKCDFVINFPLWLQTVWLVGFFFNRNYRRLFRWVYLGRAFLLNNGEQQFKERKLSARTDIFKHIGWFRCSCTNSLFWLIGARYEQFEHNWRYSFSEMSLPVILMFN